MTELTMSNLYQRLEEVGFSKEFVKSIGLPSWWTEELDSSSNLGVVYEAASNISTNLFLDLQSLISIEEVKFKRDMNYLKVINTLKQKQEKFKELEQLNVDVISSDSTGTLEQLLNYKF